MFAYKNFYGTAQEYHRLWDKEIIFRDWMIDEIVFEVKNMAVVRRFKACAIDWVGEYVNNDSFKDIVAGKLGTVRLPSKSEIEDNFYIVLLDEKIDRERLKIKVNKP